MPNRSERLTGADFANCIKTQLIGNDFYLVSSLFSSQPINRHICYLSSYRLSDV
nr:MAG TPA: hypothetical protein [Caudoviricetes sp.]